MPVLSKMDCDAEIEDALVQRARPETLELSEREILTGGGNGRQQKQQGGAAHGLIVPGTQSPVAKSRQSCHRIAFSTVGEFIPCAVAPVFLRDVLLLATGGSSARPPAVPCGRRKRLKTPPKDTTKDTSKDATIFSSDVKVVNVLATVRTKAGDIIADLTKDDFLLLEDGRPQTIKYFSRETNLPLILGLLVDTQRQPAVMFWERKKPPATASSIKSCAKISTRLSSRISISIRNSSRI